MFSATAFAIGASDLLVEVFKTEEQFESNVPLRAKPFGHGLFVILWKHAVNRNAFLPSPGAQ